MPPTLPPRPHVEPCSCCGQPAEHPSFGERLGGGRRRGRLVLCVDRFQLLLEDVAAYWSGLPGRKQG
jgi:hypothetical protein